MPQITAYDLILTTYQLINICIDWRLGTLLLSTEVMDERGGGGTACGTGQMHFFLHQDFVLASISM